MWFLRLQLSVEYSAAANDAHGQELPAKIRDMRARDPMLELASGPFLRSRQSTTRIMWEVFAALVPVIVAAAVVPRACDCMKGAY